MRAAHLIAADLARVATDQAAAADAADWDAVLRYDVVRAELLHALAAVAPVGESASIIAALDTARDCAARVQQALRSGEQSMREQMSRIAAGDRASHAYRMQGRP